jgi:hypothetical protein
MVYLQAERTRVEFIEADAEFSKTKSPDVLVINRYQSYQA